MGRANTNTQTVLLRNYRMFPRISLLRMQLLFVGISLTLFICTSYISTWCKLEDNHSPKTHLNRLHETKKVVIISTYRSGSSFFGSLLHSHPKSYYFFEPVLKFRSRYAAKFEGERNASEIVEYIKDLLECRFEGWRTQLNYSVRYGFMKRNHAYNNKYRQICPRDSPVTDKPCYNLKTASEICFRSKIRIMKVLRLNLQEGAEQLLNEVAELKIVYLVRDPRGTMKSRKARAIWKWCRSVDTCRLSAIHCHYLKSEIKYSCYLDKMYPERFALIRYEDLSCQPFLMASYIFKFLGYSNYTDTTASFITNKTQGVASAKVLRAPYATSRFSKKVAFAWQNSSDLARIREIETSCRRVLQMLYNYRYSIYSRKNCNCEKFIKGKNACYPRLTCPSNISQKIKLTNAGTL